MGHSPEVPSACKNLISGILKNGGCNLAIFCVGGSLLAAGRHFHRLLREHGADTSPMVSLVASGDIVGAQKRFPLSGTLEAVMTMIADGFWLARLRPVQGDDEESTGDLLQRYLAVFENMAAASCIDKVVYENGVAVDYIILDVNPAFENIIGVVRDEVVGRKASEIYGPGPIPFLDIYAHVAETGCPTEFESFFPPIGKTLYITAGCPQKGFFSTVFTDISERKKTEEAAKQAAREWQSTFDSSNDIIWILDSEHRIVRTNRVAERFFGVSTDQLIGRKCWEVVHCTENPHPDCPVVRTRSSGLRETMDLKIGDRWFRITSDPIKDDVGEQSGAVHIISDITSYRLADDLINIRLKLMEYARNHTLMEVLTRTLDEVEDLTCSSIGFYHFVADDQETLTLQAWSTRTSTAFCKASGSGLHYSVSEAGVWVDCIRERRPVIHNDYLSLPNRRGMPEGHAPVVRELVVPIMRRGKIVAVLGVGNKGTDYRAEDVRLVDYVADLAWEVAEYKRAEEALSRSENLFRGAFDGDSIGRSLTGLDGRFIRVNRRFCEMLGYSREELEATAFSQITHPDDLEASRRCMEMMLSEGHPSALIEKRYLRKDRTWLWAEVRSTLMCSSAGHPEYFITGILDISARKVAEEEKARLEAQLRHSQKMESMGRLAGGIAHDFNNLLGAIMGYAELVKDAAGDNQSISEDVGEIINSVNSAAGLTKQLLAFSRKQAFEQRIININAIINGSLKMLRRLIGEDVSVDFHPSVGLWDIKGDKTQIEQILFNLAINARDAMPNGGTITIETRNLSRAEVLERFPASLLAVDCVLLTVSDTGSGMSAEVLDHVFEPFFTTKEARGTGLGLATVYGIVQQHGGWISVSSWPGEGSRFDVLIVRTDSERPADAERDLPTVPANGSETIMLIEDSDSLRTVTRRVIEGYGYTVISASNGRLAVEIAEKYRGRIALIVSDLIMPQMNGVDACAEIIKSHPEARIMFMSGYADDSIFHSKNAPITYRLLKKPFASNDLLQAVRDALDAQS